MNEVAEINRRGFIRRAGKLAGSVLLARDAGVLRAEAPSGLNRFNLGVISDGLSPDFETALQTMKNSGLSWVEIRKIWGRYNTEATPGEVQRVRELLDKYQFRCSQVDTALFKCTLPGTQPVVALRDSYPYAGQMDLLKRAMDRAQAWGTDKLRVFSFWRVAQPGIVMGTVAEHLQKAAEVAASAHMRLEIENEYDCNAGTVRELAGLLKVLPSNVGANWDIGNGLYLGEVPYPDGYQHLDLKRLWNLHLKGVQCRAAPGQCQETYPDEGQIRLADILRALRRHSYRGTLSIECEFKAPGLTQTETTQRALAGMLKLIAVAA